ncbi:MAG TPA: hypothetical protein VGD60_14640 [Candidatus Acidoferrales bacterium]
MTLDKFLPTLAALAIFATSFLAGAGRAVAQQLPAPPAASSSATASTPASSPPAPSYEESLESLDLLSSHLTAQPPLLAETYDLPGKSFTRELVQLKWRPGDPLDLYVIRPRGVANPPVILYLYSYPQDTERFQNDGWCNRVTSGGYAAVGFVSALTGHRYHDVPMKEWFVSDLPQALVTSAHDVQMIINYLSTRHDLDLNQIGMFGQGSGGAIAVLAASVDHRIKALDLVDPWGDWPVWLAEATLVPDKERKNYLTPEFLSSVAPFDPLALLPKLNTIPVRLEQQAGNGVPAAAEDKLQSAIPSSGKSDRYADEHAFAEAMNGGRLFDWLKSQLKTESGAKEVAASSK